MAIAKVFKSGNSQAIRLPKEFRLKATQVELTWRGDELIVREPKKRSLASAFQALASMPDDFFPEGRIDSPPQKRKGV